MIESFMGRPAPAENHLADLLLLLDDDEAMSALLSLPKDALSDLQKTSLEKLTHHFHVDTAMDEQHETTDDANAATTGVQEKRHTYPEGRQRSRQLVLDDGLEGGGKRRRKRRRQHLVDDDDDDEEESDGSKHGDGQDRNNGKGKANDNETEKGNKRRIENEEREHRRQNREHDRQGHREDEELPSENEEGSNRGDDKENPTEDGTDHGRNDSENRDSQENDEDGEGEDDSESQNEQRNDEGNNKTEGNGGVGNQRSNDREHGSDGESSDEHLDWTATGACERRFAPPRNPWAWAMKLSWLQLPEVIKTHMQKHGTSAETFIDDEHVLQHQLKGCTVEELGDAFMACLDYTHHLQRRHDMDRARWLFSMLMYNDLVKIIVPGASGKRVGSAMHSEIEQFLAPLLEQPAMAKLNVKVLLKNLNEWSRCGAKLAGLCDRFGEGCLLVLAPFLSRDFLKTKMTEKGNYFDEVIVWFNRLELKDFSESSSATALGKNIRSFLIAPFEEAERANADP